MQSPPISCYLVPLSPKHVPQNASLKHRQNITFLPQSETPFSLQLKTYRKKEIMRIGQRVHEYFFYNYYQFSRRSQ